MRYKTYLITGLALAWFTVGNVQAASSAKFAATWTDTPALASVAVIENATTDTVAVDVNMGHTLATLKVPQDKELLIGLSAEIGLATFGSVKGKNGGSGTAKADAEAYVNIFAVPTGDFGTVPGVQAAPGQVMLSRRVQAISATLGGVIQSCTDTLTEDTDGDDIVDDVDGTIDVATECDVTDEEIALLLETTAAHHFNFVLPDMDQGEYDIVAVFTTGARAEVAICDPDDPCSYDADGTVSASATASVVINKTMLTVQQVRAAKGGTIDAEIIGQ